MTDFERMLYDAIFDFLQDNLTPTDATIQTKSIIKQIIDIDLEINTLIKNNTTDISKLTKKFHTYKNLLLYGDFYYESDLCQDIEVKLRETNNVSAIETLYNELQSSLKM